MSGHRHLGPSSGGSTEGQEGHGVLSCAETRPGAGAEMPFEKWTSSRLRSWNRPVFPEQSRTLGRSGDVSSCPLPPGGRTLRGAGAGSAALGQPSYLLAGSSGRAHSPREGGATVTLIFLRGPRAPRTGGAHCPGSLCGRARGRPGSRASQPLLLPHAGAASSPKNPEPPRTWGADGDMGTGVPDPLPLDRH